MVSFGQKELAYKIDCVVSRRVHVVQPKPDVSVVQRADSLAIRRKLNYAPGLRCGSLPREESRAAQASFSQ
jgi:hypothetical protein